MQETESPRHTVLIVEDEPLSARVARKILDRLGYEVGAVLGTGEEALEWVARQPPDAVLMDINLAGAMDGVTAAGLIVERHDVPVIFLTAAVGREILDRVTASGASGYIHKPVKLLDLKANLEMTIHRHRLERRFCSGPEACQLLRGMLEAVLAAVPQPVMVLDPEGRVLYASPAAAGGVSSAALRGRRCEEAFPGQPLPPAEGDVAFPDAAGVLAGWVRVVRPAP